METEVDDGGDSGTTLIEVAVSAAVMAVAMAVFTTATVQIFQSVNKVDALSTAQSQIAAAFQRLDKEVRYASAISTPAQAGGNFFVEYTLITMTTNTCVQLQMSPSTGRLLRRAWSRDGVTVTPSEWAVLLTSVASAAPFSVHAGDATFASPTLTISLGVSAGAGGSATSRETAVHIAALNATSTQPTATVCAEGRMIP